MFDGILSLEKTALERLTQHRRVSGSLGTEMEEMLYLAGILWDEVEGEYFNFDQFLTEANQTIVTELIPHEDYS
tara:strand:+ start:624 stop:845 length:222 start_codon:yes stop_codon:yes gene_type:complete